MLGCLEQLMGCLGHLISWGRGGGGLLVTSMEQVGGQWWHNNLL